MSYSHALKVVLQYEGGYSDHPMDRGGPTNKGITQTTYDEWCTAENKPLRSVRDISEYDVTAIYHQNYWRPARCGDLPDALALAHFDAAVNHGVKRAIRLLQQTVGAKPDGAFGPRTAASVKSALELLGEPEIVRQYIGVREDFYDDIVTANPSQYVFLNGWKNRLDRLRRETDVA